MAVSKPANTDAYLPADSCRGVQSHADSAASSAAHHADLFASWTSALAPALTALISIVFRARQTVAHEQPAPSALSIRVAQKLFSERSPTAIPRRFLFKLFHALEWRAFARALPAGARGGKGALDCDQVGRTGRQTGGTDCGKQKIPASQKLIDFPCSYAAVQWRTRIGPLSD